jgi:hypothetical protein
MKFNDEFCPSSSKRLRVGRQRVLLDLAKAKNNNYVGLTPSIEVESRKVFDEVIYNNKFEQTEMKDDIVKGFSIPKYPVFHIDYTGKGEGDIADRIVKHRILPIMRKARVQHLDCFEMSFIWINVLL